MDFKDSEDQWACELDRMTLGHHQHQPTFQRSDGQWIRVIDGVEIACMSPEENAAYEADLKALCLQLSEKRKPCVVEPIEREPASSHQSELPLKGNAIPISKFFMPPKRVSSALPARKPRSRSTSGRPHLHIVPSDDVPAKQSIAGEYEVPDGVRAAYVSLVLKKKAFGNGNPERLAAIISDHLLYGNGDDHSSWVPRATLHDCPVRRIRKQRVSFYAVIDEDRRAVVAIYTANEFSRIIKQRKLLQKSARSRPMRLPRLGRRALVSAFSQAV